MYLEIVTPSAKVFEGEVSVVTFPGTDESFQVMNDHAPMVSTLAPGKLIYKNKQGNKKYTHYRWELLGSAAKQNSGAGRRTGRSGSELKVI